jgi:hypothetical protein
MRSKALLLAAIAAAIETPDTTQGRGDMPRFKLHNFKGSHVARFYPTGTCPDGYVIVNSGGTIMRKSN